MNYGEMIPGRFLERPNRFIAYVEIGGVRQVCHVKNTGRCRELLPAGAKVWCRYDGNSGRKTHYDLIAVEKGARLINMDSQAPNKAAGEWLAAGGLGEIENLRAEATIGDSRFDFAGAQDGRRMVIEVKGCTLEENGVARFPDAPTLRGVKHLRGLTALAKDGCRCAVLIVIQMKGVRVFQPNWKTQPEFGEALIEARDAGVEIVALDCRVVPGTVEIDKHVPVDLSCP